MSSKWEDPGFTLIESLFLKTPVISSDCPNGPKEILSNGQNGYLFKNNNLSDFLKKFDEFKNIPSDELKKKRFLAKKQVKMFTQFAHFKSLENIIELDGKKIN